MNFFNTPFCPKSTDNSCFKEIAVPPIKNVYKKNKICMKTWDI